MAAIAYRIDWRSAAEQKTVCIALPLLPELRFHVGALARFVKNLGVLCGRLLPELRFHVGTLAGFVRNLGVLCGR